MTRTIVLLNKYLQYSGGVEYVMDRYSDVLRALGYDLVIVGQELLAGQTPAAFVDSARAVQVVPNARIGQLPVRFGRVAERSVRGSAGRALISEISNEYDVAAVIAFNAYHYLGFGFLDECERRRIPTILSLHDYKPACTNYKFFDEKRGTLCMDCVTGGARAYLHRPIVRGCVKGSRLKSAALTIESVAQHRQDTYARFTAVVALNGLQRDSLTHVGVAPERIHVIPNAVDDDRTQAGHVDRGDKILYVGRLAPEKGVALLLKAARAANVTLRIVGDGPERTALQSLALQLGGNVEFCGWLSPSDVKLEMMSARLLAVPSQWPEVFPLVVCEAMMLGTPVIASRIGGHIDLLASERGALVEPGAVGAWTEALLTPESILTQCAAAARTYAVKELSAATWRTRLQGLLVSAGIRTPYGDG